VDMKTRRLDETIILFPCQYEGFSIIVSSKMDVKVYFFLKQCCYAAAAAAAAE